VKQIAIYVDQGVDGMALKQLVKCLHRDIDLSAYQLVRLGAQQLIEEDWEKNTSLFIVPGGRDLYYHMALKGRGNEKLRNFVANGGSYLGICAGAYFGASAIEFEKGGSLQVLGERELALFPGKAVGPAYGPNKYSYDSLKGIEAASIKTEREEIYLYFNGGCFFSEEEKYPGIKIFARYSELEKEPPAIVVCPFGKGKAVLSGVHFEYSACSLPADNVYIQRILPFLEQSEKRRTSLIQEIFHILLGN